MLSFAVWGDFGGVLGAPSFLIKAVTSDQRVGKMIFEISCSADLACDQKNSGASMGGPAFFSTLLGPGWGTIWLPSLRHRGRSQREPPKKFKTQSKNAPLKNQRFQFWRWLLKTATQGVVQVEKKCCIENQRF